jgi:hypothetical protein
LADLERTILYFKKYEQCPVVLGFLSNMYGEFIDLKNLEVELKNG